MSLLSEREDKLPKQYAVNPSIRIPDCSDPESVKDWDWTELSVRELGILLKIYEKQPRTVDQLGCTDVATRMATWFTALTKRPTSPATLFRELQTLRKQGRLGKKPGSRKVK